MTRHTRFSHLVFEPRIARLAARRVPRHCFCCNRVETTCESNSCRDRFFGVSLASWRVRRESSTASHATPPCSASPYTSILCGGPSRRTHAWSSPRSLHALPRYVHAAAAATGGTAAHTRERGSRAEEIQRADTNNQGTVREEANSDTFLAAALSSNKCIVLRSPSETPGGPSRRHLIRLGHPWIYDYEIKNIGAFTKQQTGEMLPVYDSNGEYIGSGILSRQASVAVRMLTKGIKGQSRINGSRGFVGEPPVDALVTGRFVAALQRRGPSAEVSQHAVDSSNYNDKTSGESAWRAVDGEADGVPGVEVDVYGKAAVLRLHSQSMRRFIPAFIRLLKQQLCLDTLCIQTLESKKEKLAQVGEETRASFGSASGLNARGEGGSFTALQYGVAGCLYQSCEFVSKWRAETETCQGGAEYRSELLEGSDPVVWIVVGDSPSARLPVHLFLPPYASFSSQSLHLLPILRRHVAGGAFLAVDGCMRGVGISCLRALGGSIESEGEAGGQGGAESLVLVETSETTNGLNEKAVAANRVMDAVNCIYTEDVVKELYSMRASSLRFRGVYIHLRPKIRFTASERGGQFGRWFRPSLRGIESQWAAAAALVEPGGLLTASLLLPTYLNSWALRSLCRAAEAAGRSAALVYINAANANARAEDEMRRWIKEGFMMCDYLNVQNGGITPGLVERTCHLRAAEMIADELGKRWYLPS
ncbi:hypothetical protein cyc_06169 [Cyclospora cayetanensis]|uniref:RlmI-like PUA domain-containing protein n=1 Tax=Cyclospora cayetanensis TaxID=88456 RepID=A0A1D3CSG2_9EIME|nr:hypothetical protein cyc_06169 [Cyclospora cayetanensis]